MEFELPGRKGKRDQTHGAQQRRFPGGGRGCIRRTSMVVGSSQLPHGIIDLETEIHNVEQEAYTSVLRAFKAQSDAITWEKESLITELRKELRVSDEEHRILLSRVNADEIIQKIRDWRKISGLQPNTLSSSQPAQDHRVPSPTVSTTCKKRKTLKLAGTMSFGVSSPTGRTPITQSSLAPKQSQFSGTVSIGRPNLPSWGSSGAFAENGPTVTRKDDKLVRRKVRRSRPEDNDFYEASHCDYNPLEISRQDIKWEGENPEIFPETGNGGAGHGFKKSTPHAGAGAGRGVLIKGVPKGELPASRNGNGRMQSGDIQILHTDTLVKEVKRIFSVNPPDPTEIERAKRVLNDHERSLVDAINRLGDVSDDESGSNDCI